jgi:hypothetical protein
MLPLAMHIQGRKLSIRTPIAKAIAMTLALGAFGAAFLWLAAGKVCSGGYGIKFCDASTLVLLAGAAIPMSVIRTATIGQVLSGRRWLPHLPLAASLAFGAALVLGWARGPSLALCYALTCWAILGLLAAATFLIRRPAPSRTAPAALGGDG